MKTGDTCEGICPLARAWAIRACTCSFYIFLYSYSPKKGARSQKQSPKREKKNIWFGFVSTSDEANKIK